MKKYKIFADFNNSDSEGRLRLNLSGSLEDITKQGIILNKGMKLLLNDNDSLEVEGIIEFSVEENIWVAKIDWKRITHY